MEAPARARASLRTCPTMVERLQRYVAIAGDYLVKIAQAHGTTWQVIWRHDANADHRRKRGSPDVLMPGDVLFIPVVEAPPPPPPPPVPPGERPWPYPPPPDDLLLGKGPRWACPGGTCECHAPGGGEEILRTCVVFLHDDRSARMADARYRVWALGRCVADAAADASGAIEITVAATVESVVLEWSPASMPIDANLPYRRRYHVDLGQTLEVQMSRRLEHIGARNRGSLARRVAAFQEAYGLPVDGSEASLEPVIGAYHERGMLPALGDEQARGVPIPPLPPDVRTPHQGAVSAVSDRTGDCVVCVQIVLRDGSPVNEEPFVLSLPSGRTFEGVSSVGGEVDFRYLEPGDYRLRIRGESMYVPASIEGAERRRLRLVPDSEGS